jgi:hypothetical protein
MADTQTPPTYKWGDIASCHGQLVTVESGPLIDASGSRTSVPAFVDGRPQYVDTPGYAVQREGEEHLWYVHEEDLLPIPEGGDSIAKAVWDAAHPEERQHT